MERKKTIALVAHDNCKHDLVEWVAFNKEIIRKHKLVCTGTTGRLIEEALSIEPNRRKTDVEITKLKSGPLGGDQQLGAMIAEGDIDVMIFFWDPMMQQPHDVDVKALTRIAVLYNVLTANNRSTADFIITSPLFESDYKPRISDFSDYLTRSIPNK
jgi:methylglyoxal synthase